MAEQDERQSGVELIAAERRRQIEQEGWNATHDDTTDSHDKGEMADCAAAYAVLAGCQSFGMKQREAEARGRRHWVWDWQWWKPSDDPIRNLTKAGALIAAEIDRLQRAKVAR